ncbi:MAG: TIGR02281 family clan AA aspartic protease [Caulobacteraceae bacterium]|nr:TIGR02281 family clan AA aspartic protease [Caulobacteraceae bacterium]
MDWVFVLKMLGMLALASVSLFARPHKLNEALGHLLAWGSIAGVLLLGFTFKDQLGEGLLRVRSALIPGYAVPLTPCEAVLNQSADGAYYAVAQVNGTPVTFQVDTGASDIVLSPADAKRLGVDVSSLSFDDATETANGVGHGARFSARSMEVGSIKLADVRMSINQAPMSTSLLGMAFFNKLKSFTFEGGRLRLKAR